MIKAKCANCHEEIQQIGDLWEHSNTNRASCRPTEATPEPAEPNQTFQTKVQIWAQACFAENAPNKAERTYRFLEEALELVQVCGCTRDETVQLVNYVFGRPIGKLAQEAGGTLTTLYALCIALDLDLKQCGINELARCWENIETIRAKHLRRPKDSPLPQPIKLMEMPSTLGMEISEDVRQQLEVVIADLNQINFTREAAKTSAENFHLLARARVRIRGVLGLSLVTSTNPCSTLVPLGKEIS